MNIVDKAREVLIKIISQIRVRLCQVSTNKQGEEEKKQSPGLH